MHGIINRLSRRLVTPPASTSGVDEGDVPNESVPYNAPACMFEASAMSDALTVIPQQQQQQQRGQNSSTNGEGSDDCCSICLESLTTAAAAAAAAATTTTTTEAQGGGDSASVVAVVVLELKPCRHRFHHACLRLHFEKQGPKCPVCRLVVGAPQGKSPSGILTISKLDQPCPGYVQDSSPSKAACTIVLTYSIPSGNQASYHESPGTRYEGTHRTAYLPNNADGRALLLRMKYAWRHGLIFSIGTSLTTGRSNTTVWSCIPHKTSLCGGAHGMPDPNYLFNANTALDNLGVPPAARLSQARRRTRPSCGSGALAGAFAQSPKKTKKNDATLPSETIRYDAPQHLIDTVAGSALRILDKNTKTDETINSGNLVAMKPPPPAAAPAATATGAAVARRPPQKKEEDLEDCWNHLLEVLKAPPQAGAAHTKHNRKQPAKMAAGRDKNQNGNPKCDDDDDDCPICLDSMSTEHTTVQIKACRHAFHQSCLQDCWENPRSDKFVCPLCQGQVAESPLGRSPSGTMTVSTIPHPCPGFAAGASAPPSHPTIQVTYSIPQGVQRPYHGNPGVPYRGDRRSAYLPNTAEGRALVKRLQRAFQRGLVFNVGTSQTTGKSDVVVWTTLIPHKTSLQPGDPFGYPDPQYLQTLSDCFDKLSIPIDEDPSKSAVVAQTAAAAAAPVC